MKQEEKKARTRDEVMLVIIVLLVIAFAAINYHYPRVEITVLELILLSCIGIAWSRDMLSRSKPSSSGRKTEDKNILLSKEIPEPIQERPSEQPKGPLEISKVSTHGYFTSRAPRHTQTKKGDLLKKTSRKIYKGPPKTALEKKTWNNTGPIEPIEED